MEDGVELVGRGSGLDAEGLLLEEETFPGSWGERPVGGRLGKIKKTYSMGAT